MVLADSRRKNTNSRPFWHLAVSDRARNMRLHDKKAINIEKLSTGDYNHYLIVSIPALKLRTQNILLNVHSLDMKCDKFSYFPTIHKPLSIFQGCLVIVWRLHFVLLVGLHLSKSVRVTKLMSQTVWPNDNKAVKQYTSGNMRRKWNWWL